MDDFPKQIFICVKNHTKHDIEIKKKWKILNKGFKVNIYDDKECIAILKKHYGDLHKNIFEFIQDGPIKADFWRVCVLFKFGGVYTDVDVVPFKPLNDFVEDNVDFVTCSAIDKRFMYNPNFIIAKKGCNILRRCINWYINKYNKSENKYEWYWGWSIMRALSDNLKINELEKNTEGIFLYNDKKIQLIKENKGSTHVEDNNTYKGVVLFNNRSSDWDYINHKFKDTDNKKDLIINTSLNLKNYDLNYGKILLSGSLKKTYEVGIVIPSFHRENYLQVTLDNIKNADLNNVIITIIDESNTTRENKKIVRLIENFKIEGCAIIKIFKNKHGNMYDSYNVGFKLLRDNFNCKYYMTLDSDVTLNSNKSIQNIIAFHKYVETLNKKCITSGFNTPTHKKTIVNGNLTIKETLGGINLCFSKEILNKILPIFKCLKWDWNVSYYITKNDGLLACTTKSEIQHIGERGLWSKPTRYDIGI